MWFARTLRAAVRKKVIGSKNASFFEHGGSLNMTMYKGRV